MYLMKKNKIIASSLKLLCISLSLILLGFSAYAQTDDLHSKWQSLLNKHVQPINEGHSTQVNYAGFLTQRAELKAYLHDLEKVNKHTFDKWRDDQQLAFLINAYNAWTVELILTKYPKLESIKDLGGFFSSPWGKSFISLLGETYSLDDIEHDLIRGGNKYKEPRIHFAVNCASVGCPALREEAYQAELLDKQLAQQTTRFLSDKSRNYLDNEGLNVSPIFKWYKGDFEDDFRGATTLPAFLALYAKELGLGESQKSLLMQDEISVNYLDYDWQLNDIK